MLPAYASLHLSKSWSQGKILRSSNFFHKGQSWSVYTCARTTQISAEVSRSITSSKCIRIKRVSVRNLEVLLFYSEASKIYQELNVNSSVKWLSSTLPWHQISASLTWRNSEIWRGERQKPLENRNTCQEHTQGTLGANPSLMDVQLVIWKFRALTTI